MIAAMKSYPAMEDSGVEWLGEVPEHWEVRRLGTSVHGCINGTWGGEPDGRDDLPCVRVADFDRLRLRIDLREPTIRAVPIAERKGRILNGGDLLLEKSGGGDLQLVGAVMLYDHEVPAVCSNFIGRMAVSPGHNPQYLSYLHSHLYTIRLNARSIKQTTGIQNLDSTSYLGERVAFAPLSEQVAIVRFLDHADRRIRRYLRAKEKLIELLEEQKQAIIHQAVTGRIDVRTGQPYAAYKDSGVEWLGEVPEHWEVGPLKRFVARKPGAIKAGPFGSQLTLAEMAGADYKVYTQRNVIARNLDGGDKYVSRAKFEDLRAFEVVPGDVLITSRGTIGRTALVTRGCRAGILHPCLLRVQVDPRHLGRRFLMTLVQDSALLPRQLAFLSNATTIDVIYSDTLANVLIPVPPREEQRCIGEYLSDRKGILKAASSQAARQIELLNEYRTRLTADVVTGKADVRDVGAVLPDLDPLPTNDKVMDTTERDAALQPSQP